MLLSISQHQFISAVHELGETSKDLWWSQRWKSWRRSWQTILWQLCAHRIADDRHDVLKARREFTGVDFQDDATLIVVAVEQQKLRRRSP